MRLLVIEDDKELALVMKEGLEERGFTVDVANALVYANVCDEYRKIYLGISFDFDDSANC